MSSDGSITIETQTLVSTANLSARETSVAW